MDWKENPYNGKKVLVTGHTGFKGPWLIKILSMLGARVKGYALAPETSPNLYDVLKVEEIATSVIGDLMDAKRLSREITTFEPDFIFHLAAQPIVRLSYEFPVETFAVNSIGTAHLLDVLRRWQHKCTVVLITTDKVYYNYEWPYAYRENDRLGGYDPYSASKACAELVIDSYRNSFFNTESYGEHHKALVVARAGNVIGGGDWAKDRLVPDIIRALQEKKEIVLRNPGAVRPWQHVLEPLYGYLLLGAMASERYGEMSNAYNFGPWSHDTLTVEEMTKSAIEIWGEGEYVVRQDTRVLHEANMLRLDISLANKELKWYPRLNASEALKWTLEWYKNYNEDPGNIREYTEKQIKIFFERS